MGDSCLFDTVLTVVGEDVKIVEIGDEEFTISDTFKCDMGETVTMGLRDAELVRVSFDKTTAVEPCIGISN